MKIGQADWFLLITTVMQIFHYMFVTFILNNLFRSNNNHSSDAWKDETNYCSPLFGLFVARTDPILTPQIFTTCVRCRTNAHARVFAPCVYIPLGFSFSIKFISYLCTIALVILTILQQINTKKSNLVLSEPLSPLIVGRCSSTAI